MLYKYRSLSHYGFYRCMDIIVKKRLYASQYLDLNDPMEGFCLYPEGKLSEEMQYKLQEQNNGIRIVSLSKRDDSTLMWSHYADGHKGIAIGIEIDEKKFDVRNVSYGDHVTITENDIDGNTCKNILCKKLSPWSYEEEVRVLTNNKHVPVRIREIVYGIKIDKSVRSVLRDIVKGIDPSIDIKRVQELK